MLDWPGARLFNESEWVRILPAELDGGLAQEVEQ